MGRTKRRPDAMTEMGEPIFIVGANRSGTTLLRLILNAHSRIAIPEELRYIHHRPGGVPIRQWHSPEKGLRWYERWVDQITRRAASVMPGLEAEEARRCIMANPDRDLRRPYATVLALWARKEGKQRWGEKTPGNLFYADILYEMFPNARFLYIVRDPRAGVCSMQETEFFTDDLVFNAMTRRRAAEVGHAILAEHVPPGRRHALRFEDLVRRPDETVREVCEFLGEPFEPRMLEFHRDARRYMKPDAVDSFNAKATRPISPESADRWRTALNEDQIAVVEHVCADEMERFGYEPTGARLNRRRRAEVLLKTAYWKVQCWRRREIRHYHVNYPIFAGLRTRVGRVVGRASSAARHTEAEV